MHDILIATGPLVAILAGILFNPSNMHSFRSEFKVDMKELRTHRMSEFTGFGSEMNARFDRVDGELRYFHGVTE